MRRVHIAGAVLLAGLLAAPAAWAGDLNGVILDVDGKSQAFTLRSVGEARPVVETFRVEDGTHITFQSKRVPFGNLVPGGYVSVRYRDNDLGPVATSVTIHHVERRK
jgi:hypothetical protein